MSLVVFFKNWKPGKILRSLLLLQSPADLYVW